MAFKNPERSLTWPPGAREGEARIVIGADTPDELAGAFNFAAVILFYVVDEDNGLERGYFFIGNSNENAESTNPALQYGEVQYPTPGDPGSATSANVKTNQVNIMHDNLVPLARFFNIHISSIGGLYFQQGATFGSIDSTFGSSDVSVAEVTQDVTGGIFRLAADAFFSAPATSRGIFLAAVMNVLSGGIINVDSGGSITGDVGSTLDWDGSATFDDIAADVGTFNTVTAAGDTLTGSQNGVNAQAVTSGQNDTTSATFVNMAGTGSQTSFAFTKRYSGTRVKIEFSFDAYCITSGTDVEVGVDIDGTDYLVRKAVLVVNQHQSYTATAYLSGVTSGAKTVQAIWRRSAGTGTARRDGGDWLSISAEEVD